LIIDQGVLAEERREQLMTKLKFRAASFFRLRARVFPEPSPTGNFLQRADTARDSGQWREAAELYARAAANDPQSASALLCQRGNCLKEAGAYPEAFAAYAAAITAAPENSQERADLDLQLGHLFKITGNFSAAARAYEQSAALGAPEASAEIESFPSVTPSIVRFLSEDSALAGAEISESVFETLLSCDLAPNPSPRTLGQMGWALATCGEKELARGFFELAYLAATDEAVEADHVGIVLQSGAWPLSHLSELTLAANSRAAYRPKDVAGRLEALCRAAGAEPDAAPAAPAAPVQSVWPPEVVDVANVEARLAPLLTALDRAYQAFALIHGDAGDDALVALRELARFSRNVAARVAFPRARSRTDLRLCASRVLGDCVAKWLVGAKSRYLSHSATPRLVGAIIALRGNPLVERLEELGAPRALFQELAENLSIAMPKATPEARDQALSRLIFATGAELSVDDLGAFAQMAADRRLPLTCEAVIICQARDSAALYDDAVATAQKLKTVGLHVSALNLLERTLDQEKAPTGALIEEALLAKIVGRFDLAARLFEICAQREPSNAFLRSELAMVLPEVEPISAILKRYGGDPLFLSEARKRASYRLALGQMDKNDIGALEGDQLRISELAPEIAVEFRSVAPAEDREEIRVLEMGWLRRRSVKGSYPSLRRVDFVRARVASQEKIVLLRVRIDGRTVGVTKGEDLKEGSQRSKLHHQIFNCWLDLASIGEGLHELQLYFEEWRGGYRTVEQTVWVDPSPSGSDFAYSTASLTLPPGAGGASVDARVAELPSVIYSDKRSLFQGDLKKILIIRADQLGDTSQSIGGMLALKAAFPDSAFECLTSPGNLDLIRSTGVFDEVHAVLLTHDPVTRRRYSTLAEQQRLREILRPKKFDLAVDLSPGFETQHLLRLVDARHTAGFKPNHHSWMTFGADVQTHDPINRREMMPHSAMIDGFVASLIAMAKHQPLVLPNRNADWELLQAFRLTRGERYAVLHSGARLAIKRWPFEKYVELARLLTTELGLKTVLLADDPALLDLIDYAAFPSGALVASGAKIAFPVFDSLLSLCALFVGNDTGPKHLASLRGAPVVSVHMGQVNWSEWGQDAGGYVVARRAPCVGCGIELVEECGKGLPCLNDIQPAEVFEAARMALADRTRAQGEETVTETEMAQ
jgi:ADP-heptose:LPS heptosyltransferase/tetratricopeptide (TPR) repeat protein